MKPVSLLELYRHQQVLGELVWVHGIQPRIEASQMLSQD